MPRPTPTPRQQPGRVAMQVARDGGPARTEPPGGAVPTRGRHRTPDTGEVTAWGPASEVEGAPRPSADPAAPSTPPRHGVTARRAQIAARRTAPGSLERVEAAQVAASRPASTPRPAPAPVPATTTAAPVPRPAATSAAAPRPFRPAALEATADEDDAVTDLVAGPARRGRATVPDGPGTGRMPGLLGLVLGALALIGAVIAAGEPDVVVPVIGRLGSSPLALAGLLALGLLATACAALGTG
ncbi:MAG TPA: hypothetical protein VGI02_27980, partial [Actinomycetospora sp.]